MFRASSMEGKHEMFWKQGDFGYVKDVKDSLITMCEPVEQVWPIIVIKLLIIN